MQASVLEGATSADGLVKYEELWYQDGNLVIQTGNTLFKVHQSILCQNSSIFADMFTLPQPNQSDDCFEGTPIVQLHDTAEEMADFLKGICRSSTFSAGTKPSFRQTIAFARLGTKYNVPHIRQFALRHLRQSLPLNVERFSVFLSEQYWEKSITAIIPFEVMHLARQLDIPDLLPTAFVLASAMKTDYILSPEFTRLTDADKLRCLSGRELLLATNSVFVAHIATATCPNRSDPCNALFRTILASIKYHPHNSFSIRLGDLPGFCTVCGESFKKNLMEVRKAFWNRVPTIFDLPSWDVLRAKREEEGVTPTSS